MVYNQANNKAASKVEGLKWSCSQRCKKWDRKAASAFGLLAFFTLLGFVIYGVLKQKPSCATSKSTMLRSTATIDGCELMLNCVVFCSEIIESRDIRLAARIKATPEIEKCKSIDLEIYDSQFLNNEIERNWLETISQEVSVLKIHKTSIQNISEYALSEYPFKKLSSLVLTDTDLNPLKKKYFLHMESLNSFEYGNFDQTLSLGVEAAAFEGMETIEIMSFSKVILNRDDLSNSFGCNGTSLSKLATLSLNANNIKEIDQCSFKNIRNVKQIFLEGSNLKEIHRDAFATTIMVERIHLSNNELTIMYNGTFRNLNNLQSQGIKLGKNPWNCSCSLQWLKRFYIETYFVNKTIPPKCDDLVEFEDYNFCPGLSSTSDTTTTLSTTSSNSKTPNFSKTTLSNNSSTRFPFDEYVVINCTEHLPEYDYDKLVRGKYFQTSVVIIEDIEFRLTFFEVESVIFEIQIRVDPEIDFEYNLIWFNTDDKEECNCEAVLYDGIVLNTLKRSTTYTFSVIGKHSSTVSPKATFGLTTQAEWTERTWLSNKLKMPIILSVSICVMFLLVMTSVVTFLLIRRFPSTIAGNKNVVIMKPIVKDSEPQYPKELERPAYWEPYMESNSQGYLTPRAHRYDKVRYRPPLVRSISEWSIGNAAVRYDDPRNIYGTGGLRERMHQRLVEQRNVKNYYDFDKPPLPPPNTNSKLRKQSNDVQESVYTAV